MNKKMNIICSMAIALIAAQPVVMAQTAEKVNVVCNDLVQRGDSVYIDALVTVPADAVKSSHYLELTPVFSTASQKTELPSILINGKSRQKLYNRMIALNNLKNDAPHYAVVTAEKGKGLQIPYKTAVGYQDWMKDAQLTLNPDNCGCGLKSAGDPLLVSNKIRRRPDQRYLVAPTYAYISPEAETVKNRAEVGEAYLDFQVGKYQILQNFRNNASELNKIDKTINTITTDKNVTAKGVELKGFASPEGSYKSNATLSDNRVKALRDYVAQKHEFANSFFRLSTVPEDWDGFKAKLEADDQCPSRDAVMAIINSSNDPDQKEAALRKLDGGAAYRYVLQNIFPSLRRSEYKVDYTVRFFTVEEGREVIKTHPQQLSLSEMYAVANSYQVGSEDYNNVFETAVRMFSNDPVANLNAANIAMSKGDMSSASKYLAKAGNSPQAINARGVYNMMQGNLDEAGKLLREAESQGVKEATANLKELQKKIDDNALFDSYK